MTIHLPENLERPILDAVHSGRYASLDAAMADAASLLIQRLSQEEGQADRGGVASTTKPIWEEILELADDVPAEEWDRLPHDLAEQHDHYIHGTPRRPAP
jgi:Arc/MetJ-type ribon-helix-helix transcriptional regulator